jgi:Tfp pilus assembly protein PilF
MLNLVVVFLIFFASLIWSEGGFADTNCPKESSATLISLQGKALVETGGKGIPREVKLNDKICQGDLVSTQPNSRVSLELPGNEILRLKEKTEITLAELNINTASIIKIAKGFLNFISRKPKEIKIESGITNAMPLGTEFAFNVDETKASVWVYEGKVKVFNQYGSVIIEPGNYFAQVEKGQAPKVQIDIHPRDAVNWALYYPPLLPYPAKTNDIDNDIRLAIEDYRHGQVNAALTKLDTLPHLKQTPYFHKVRGAIRLTVGQDGLASDDINALLAINPNDAEALVLQSVRALSQNHKEDAYTLANKAIKANPQSASAYSALSYAEQGRFQLDKALAAAKNAAKLAPHDAMTFARQAELELALGLSSDSEQSAHHALALDANLERTQTVMGFSHLTSMDTDEALHSFNQAIQLDSTAPLPRLGLGLAKIRDGDLAEGRKDIEIAALLDPNNSLIRSYLGKAYYEENRNPLAEEQFTLAKERDPKDPTPYFYDALKKQTENRPVEALHDLQKAMELNDNRAVYRSKLLLDSDRAARGATLARIYNNLGFQQRGVVEAISSLQTDPSNYSAHRFLSDSYVNQPNRENAQLSELLQAKILQPINVNPVQPHLSVSERGLLNTPSIANSSFQDFTRIYERNRPHLFVSGIAGTNNTFGDEVTISGIHNDFSYSLGQFHLSTDGINNTVLSQYIPNLNINTKEQHDIYDIFLQKTLIETLNLQFEYINRNTYVNNTIDFTPGYLKEHNIRSGLHWQPTKNQHIIAQYTYKNIILKEVFDQSKPDYQTDLYKVDLFEGQYIDNNDVAKIISGFGYYDIPHYNSFNNTPPATFNRKNGFDIYTYAYFNIFDKMGVTLGFTFDSFPNFDNNHHRSKFSQKFGVQWGLSDNFKLRLAHYDNIQKHLFVRQNLEPTQVAGFTQVFDDYNDFKHEFNGAAVDFSSKNIYSGIEANKRSIFRYDDENRKNFIGTIENYKTYLNILILNNFAVSGEYKFERDYFNVNQRAYNTHKIPIKLSYFNTNGLFFDIQSTWVLQNIQQFSKVLPISETNSQFVLFDTSLGYRLPNKLGILSLEVKNILDKQFKYDNFLGLTQTNIFSNNLEFFPQRTILGKIVINF